ncbi:hypothetical protein IPL68_07925 [Candidatus Saccharibacteria bacterium]|nr:MAG: hypothetical protein IPL68_07925 [Candidatus Saccharibacteria bacterium]
MRLVKPYVFTPSDVTIVATGTMVHQALEAAEKVVQRRHRRRSYKRATIKPLDEETILTSVRKRAVLSRSKKPIVASGLGGAIAEATRRKSSCTVEADRHARPLR